MAATIDGTTGLTAPSGAIFNGIASGTAVASTSGTSIDFTSIPSWVKRVTVMLNGVSTNGTSNLLFQIGDSGGVETSSYLGGTVAIGVGTTNYTSGYLLTQTNAAANVNHHTAFLCLVGTNIWTCASSGNLSSSAAATFGNGTKSLSDTLDRVRITTVNGTDTFDAGSINILYE